MIVKFLLKNLFVVLQSLTKGAARTMPKGLASPKGETRPKGGHVKCFKREGIVKTKGVKSPSQPL